MIDLSFENVSEFKNQNLIKKSITVGIKINAIQKKVFIFQFSYK